MKKVIIYTDGACLGNPGPGGWAAILTLSGTSIRRELCGGFRKTTNNRMEILAAIEGLQALKEPCEVELYTDSRYLCDAIRKSWLVNWQKNSWLKSDKKPVRNPDLWKKLLEHMRAHQIRFNWLRGHAGHAENERCDELAGMCAKQKNLPPDEEYEKEGENTRH